MSPAAKVTDTLMPGSGRSKRSTSWNTRLLACVACAAWVGLWSGRAAAQSAAPPLGPVAATETLEYVAPPGCPSRSVWLSRVLTRLADGTEGWSTERLTAVRARVTVDGSGREARIVLHDDGIERSIIGGDCEEVTSAAALILAVALGSSPRALAAPVPEPGPAVAAPLSRVAPAAAPSPISAPPTSGDAPAAADSPIDVGPSPPPAPGTRRPWRVALGAAVEANDWVGPWPAGVFGVSFDAVSPSRGWSVRAVGVYGMTERVLDGRRAEFSYWGGHLDLCPIALGGGGSWRWTSCGELHLGVLHASGDPSSTLATSLSQRALLATVVAGTRLQTPPLGAIRLEIETGLAFSLLRQTFQFGAPEEVIFSSPTVGLLGRAGILVALDRQRD
jgi:hypothetical protein